MLMKSKNLVADKLIFLAINSFFKNMTKDDELFNNTKVEKVC